MFKDLVRIKESGGYTLNLAFKKLDYLYEEIAKNKAKVHIKPLDRGYGRTLGNSLRRILISSIPGTSIVGLKIEGSSHEFQLIEGTVNDGTEIIVNLKEMRFAFDSEKMQKFTFTGTEKGTYLAKDIALPDGVKCLTPNLELVKLTGEKEVKMTIFALRGKGYIEANEHDYFDEEEEDIMLMDGTFQTVKSPKIEIEKIRVGQDTNYEKLVLTVETDGTITPEKAFVLAVEIMRSQLSFVDDMKEYVEEYEMIEAEKEKENEILDMAIEALDLNVRPYNCLKNAKYNTIGEVLSLSREQLKAIDQLGAKSIREIEEKIHNLGYKLRDE